MLSADGVGVLRRGRRVAPVVVAALVTGLLVGVGPGRPGSVLAAERRGSPTGSSAGKPAGAGDSAETAALAKAHKTKKPVPVPALTSETTDVVAKPNGHLVATIHNRPVRARVGGMWKRIDPSLRKLADGSVAPRAATSDLRFSGGGTRPLVRMTSAGKRLALTWPGRLPAPVVRGATAVYRSVLPGVDLRMTATATGFTQLLVVKSARAARNPALARLPLGLGNTDLSIRTNKDGSLAAVDPAAGGTVFTAAAPVMYDSTVAGGEGAGLDVSGGPKSGGGASPALKAVRPSDGGGRHVARLAVGAPAGQRSLTLTPDQALLGDPHTVYPVMIDPNWQTPKDTGGWAGISKYWSNNSYWKFGGDFGTGYCPDPSYCEPGDVKRVMYAMPIKGGPLVGKDILYAEFGAYESWANNCTKEPVDLYATSKINSSTTWSNSSSTTFWPDFLQTVSDAKGWNSTCPAGYMEFGGTTSATLQKKVQDAANGDWYNVTLGLRAKDEGSANGAEWKRFTSDAYLRVRYNLPPYQIPMKSLSMSPGSACTTSVTWITKRPQVNAVATDPDGPNEKIGVQFAAAWTGSDGVYKRRWWSTGAEITTPSSTLWKASGSLFSWTLPTTIPSNQKVGWEARSWDGAAWGPWSSAGSPTDCYFAVDNTRPVGPVLSSASFPGSPDATADLPWTDGVGRYGNFVMDSASTDVVKYQYALDQMPSSAHEKATSSGAAQSVNLLLETEGPHFFSARALDAAGNASEPTVYYFNVAKGDLQRSTWAMDDSAGATRLAAAGRPITVTASSSGVTVGAPGHSGQALQLSGDAASDGQPAEYAATDAAVLDTDNGFTVSAWANLANGPNTFANHAIVSQDGTTMGGFSLGLHGGQWQFLLRMQDQTTGSFDGPAAWAIAGSTQPVATGHWTHLTGVYDAAAGTATLYVNGVQADQASRFGAMWNARGPLQFGRYLYNGKYTDGWQGGIDDVQVWDRALSATDVSNLATGHAVTGLAARAVWPLDETSGTTLTSTPQTSDAVVSGDVTAGVKGVHGTAVRLGSDGYARTDRPQVDGTRSFSVSAWVRLPTPAATDPAHMVLIQNGVHEGEFLLYYSTWYKRWIFSRYDSDSSTATLTRAMQPDCTVGSNDSNGVPCMGPTTGQWTHLVGVSDAAAHRLQLYINGYLVGTAGYTQASPWASPGPLQIGANNADGVNNQFFGGDIDEVRTFDRVVSGPEVQQLVQQRPMLAGRWKFNQASGTPMVSPDDLNVSPATLSGNASIDPSTYYVGSGALSLDGTTGYASTAAVPLHTGQSFTLTGWAQTAGTPDRNMTVWSIGNGTDSALTVRWQYLNSVTDPYTGDVTYVGQWQVDTADSSSPRVHSTAVHSFAAPADWGTYWNHLAVTYDAFAHELSLYVDGQLEDQVCDDGDTSCTDHVSFTGASQPFEATSGLQFGTSVSGGKRGEYFSGQIDDVWAYQGVLSQAQIGELANGDELDSSTGP